LDVVVERKFCPMHLIQYAVSDAASAAGVPVPRPRLRNGRPGMVFVHTEKRAGNKHVTIVRGLDAYGFTLEVLALAWKHRFATSVAVVDPVVRDHLVLKSGTKVPRLLQLQGRHDMEHHLTKEMGLPRSSLSVRT
jgi:translation initiation factor 1 (eIF-1/SUI1)